MSKTRQQAEESANAGESEDEDSQLVSARVYEQIQWAIGFQPSSSPAALVANASKEPEFSQGLENSLLNDNDSQALETPLIYDAREYANAKTHEHSSSLPDLSTRQKIIETRKLPPGCPPGWRVGFDSNKKARLFDQNGKIVNEPTKKMSSHHSSQGSTTQENSPWMYDQHNHSWSAAVEGETSQASLQPDKPSTTVSALAPSIPEDDTDLQYSGPAHSLQEDDTGHIDLITDFTQDENAGNLDLMKDFTQEQNADDYSQDRPAAADVDDEEAETQIQYPETPALTNPFKQSFHQNSVIPPSQLFKATQISPGIQAPTSAVTQRPSPDVYSADNIQSPEKKAPHSSPSFNGRAALSRRQEYANYVSRKAVAEESQSSDDFDYNESQERRKRVKLARQQAMQTISLVSSRSFKTTTRQSSGFRARASSEEIPPDENPVEKETVVAEEDVETEDNSDEEMPSPSAHIAVPVIAEEDVETEDNDDEEMPSPSAHIAIPGSTEANAAAGLRRRSLAEDYIAQTNGTDARDTQEGDTQGDAQQDDMVIDSQVLPSHRKSPSLAQDELPELCGNESETEDAPNHHSSSLAPSAAPTRQPDPLGDMSANALRPWKSKGSSLPHEDEIVLETSPYRIRPFKDLGDDSSPMDDDEPELSGIGFSQDELLHEILSQPSLPRPRTQRTPAARVSKSQIDVSGIEVEGARIASYYFPTSSLRGQVGSVQPLLEVDATPKPTARVDAPHTSTGPTVLDTPQPSNHFEHQGVQAKSAEVLAAHSLSENREESPQASNDFEDNGVQELTANSAEGLAANSTPENREESPQASNDSEGEGAQEPTDKSAEGLAADSAPEKSDETPVTLVDKGSGRVTRMRKNADSDVDPERRPSKKSKDSASSTANKSAGPSDLVDTNTGLKYSTAPEAPASSTANFFSVQSSGLSELSELSDNVDPATPEAFKGIDHEPEVANEENVAEASMVAPKGPVESLKRKRATETPPSSLEPTAIKSKSPARVTKRPGRPSRVSKGTAKATPKAVKALRGLPSSGTRSSARQARAVSASNGTPSNSAPTGSASRTRSMSRLSAAPSDRSNGNPSTPTRAKGATKKSGKAAARHGIFDTMAFAVTYVSHPKQKEDILSKISEEGGLILEPGFDQLFAVDALPVTPSRLTRLEESKDLENIKPNEDAQKITFACVIADKHSRKSKYIQALALDVPCLHGNWILTCVKKQRIVDWQPYLLCAGEPDLLGGAPRSRALAPCPPSSARFSEHFDSDDRMKLFKGKNILVVVGTSKAMVDLKKAYVFVVHAQGAAKVGTVNTIEAARYVLETDAGREKWDWVYVDKNEMAGLAALDRPQPKGKKGKKKGKKADANEPSADDAQPAAAAEPLQVKVIGDYFVVQSLFLGRLLDDDSTRAYNDPIPAREEDENARETANDGDQEDAEEGDDDQDELSI